MALINCIECDSEISDKATTCPKCGNPINIETDPLSDLLQDIDKKINPPKDELWKRNGLLNLTKRTGVIGQIIFGSLFFLIIAGLTSTKGIATLMVAALVTFPTLYINKESSKFNKISTKIIFVLLLILLLLSIFQ